LHCIISGGQHQGGNGIFRKWDLSLKACQFDTKIIIKLPQTIHHKQANNAKRPAENAGSPRKKSLFCPSPARGPQNRANP